MGEKPRLLLRQVDAGLLPLPPTWLVVVPISCLEVIRKHWPGPDCQTNATRLEVPQDIWDDLVREIDEEYKMAEEGEELKELGGLHVIGTERHDARRIDLQLRGRCGRQGDPGSSRFFLSLDDDLMRIFGGGNLKSMLSRFGMSPEDRIENKMVSRRIEAAQKKSKNETLRSERICWNMTK